MSNQLLQPWNLRKTSLLRDRSNGTRVRRRRHVAQPATLGILRCGGSANPCMENANRPRFSSRRARSDLLFTMSNNTRTDGRTRTRANLFRLLDEPNGRQGRASQAHCAIRRPNLRGRRLRTRNVKSARQVCVALDRPPIWWSQTGSNRRPPACKAGALPTELWPRQRTEDRRRMTESKFRRLSSVSRRLIMVGLGRLELPTSRLSSARSNQLSYKPVPGIPHQ